MTFLAVEHLSRTYAGAKPVEALKDIHLAVDEGEFVAIMGPSGSGKTTLLNMLATLDQPTSGQVILQNQNLQTLSEDELATFRREKLGFVFQDFNLLETLTVAENILLPLAMDHQNVAEMQGKLATILGKLGILDLRDKRTYELSGGEAQRVAIARALVHEPALILADEPTGNLDSKAAGAVMQLLSQANTQQKVTTVMVTHDAISASYSSRVVFIKDGKFYNEIYCGDDRNAFYQSILDVLAHLGGTNHAFNKIVTS